MSKLAYQALVILKLGKWLSDMSMDLAAANEGIISWFSVDTHPK